MAGQLHGPSQQDNRGTGLGNGAKEGLWEKSGGTCLEKGAREIMNETCKRQAYTLRQDVNQSKVAKAL